MEIENNLDNESDNETTDGLDDDPNYIYIINYRIIINYIID